MIEEGDNRGSAGKIILISAILIGLAAGIYFTFFFSYSCDSLTCFQAHQRECSKTHFVNNEGGTTWDYKILGKSNEACEIEVKVLKVKEGDLDRKRLEDKTMTCYLSLGDDSAPEADIANCHGLLKEELQEIIIEKLHLYVIENIGEISEELTNAV